MKDIENIIFDIAEALRVPVLVLALLALAAVLLELGAFVVELLRRRRRDFTRLETASHEARAALERGDEMGAKSALRPVAWSTQMARTLAFMVDQWGRSQIGDRLAKGLADFDFRSLKRLERTRLLVRAGPALGLMGTLIPLSPALEGLATGDVNELSENLRVAFSVTVLGLLVGAIAFAISLVRDRIYGQDLSDLEFVMATIAPEAEAVPVMAVRTAATDSRIGTVALGGAAGGSPPDAGDASGGAPAGAAAAGAPPRPSQAANVGAKPPPPKDAKPLGAELPPPGTGVRPDPAPQPAVSASGEVKPGEVAPAPSVPAAAAAPAAPAVPGAETPAAPPSPGGEPAAPPVPESPSEAGAPVDRDATRQQSMPPAPPEASPPPAPAAPAPPPAPGSEQAPTSGEDDPTNQLPGPPIPERPDGNNHPPAPERTTGEGTW